MCGAEFLMINALAVENGCSSGAPVCMTMTSHLLQPIFDRGCVISRDEWNFIRKYYIQCLAGPMAEARFNRHFQKQVAERDIQQADGPLISRNKNRQIQIWPETKEIHPRGLWYVEANSTTLYWLGYSIYSRQTIMHDEIDAAIGEAKQKAVSQS
jgi:hypothetical protein